MPSNDKTLVWDEARLEAPHAQTDKSRRVRNMFDAIAPTYEKVNALASAGRDAAWRRRMVQLAQIRSEDILLDIACGTGDVARTFAASQPRPARIIGADFSLPMLQQAMTRPIARGAFCQGDALALPLADASVTLITCAFGIRNFQNLRAGLTEMHRVLQPGGRAVILEFALPEAPVLKQLYMFYFKHILPRMATWISRDRTGAYRYLPSSVVSFAGVGEVLGALRDVGFTAATAHPMTFGVVSVFVAHKPATA